MLACDELAGTELLVANSIERFDPSAIRSELVTFAAPGPIAQRVGPLGVTVHSLGALSAAQSVARLVGVLRSGRYDVVHAYGFRPSALVRLAARAVRPRPAVVAGVQGATVIDAGSLDSFKARVAGVLEWIGSPLVDAYEACSDATYRGLVANGVSASRVRCIPGGIDLQAWAAAPARGGAIPVIACVARFRPIKRHEDVITAAALLREMGLPFRLVLAGDGPRYAAARSLVDQLGVEDVVVFSGPLDPADVISLLHQAHVFCLASISEGMPLSILEAMASGLPIVGTAVPGIQELVEHEVTGLLVPPQRPDLLAEALAALLSDAERAQRLGETGQKRVQAHSLDTMVRAKQELYLSLATARHRTRRWSTAL